MHLAYGPLVYDIEHEHFCGCLHASNNTAELSALPHILVRMLRRRAEQQRNALALWPPIHDADPDEEPPPLPIETVILAHDSTYVRTVCDVPPLNPPPELNSTVVMLCRKLLAEAREQGLHIVWVKVRGHSEAVPGKLDKRDQRDLTDAAFATIIGNDWADYAAGKGMVGRTKDVECVRAYADAYLTTAAMAVWKTRFVGSSRWRLYGARWRGRGGVAETVKVLVVWCVVGWWAVAGGS
eukprot:SAG31_NODE_63_length_28659_cov_23.074685_12_plen_239_part_00